MFWGSTSCLIEAFLSKAALKKSANTSCWPKIGFWLKLPTITSILRRLIVLLCGRISKHCGKSRPDKVQCDLLRQRLLSESVYQCSAKIGLLINGTFFESFPYNADVIFFSWLGLLWYISWVKTCFFTIFTLTIVISFVRWHIMCMEDIRVFWWIKCKFLSFLRHCA